MERQNAMSPQRVIDETFHDLALCLGGIFLVHQVEDKVVRAVMRSLDDLYVSARDRAEKALGREPRGRFAKAQMSPHPAVEAFLSKMEGRMD